MSPARLGWCHYPCAAQRAGCLPTTTCLSQVVQRIKAVEGQTQLLVVDKETDEELRRRQLTCTEEMAQRGLPPVHDPWEPKRDWIHSGSLNSEAGQKVWRALPTGTTLASPRNTILTS